MNVCIDYYHKKVNLTNIEEIPDIPTGNWETDNVISQMSNQELLAAVNELPDHWSYALVFRGYSSGDMIGPHRVVRFGC